MADTTKVSIPADTISLNKLLSQRGLQPQYAKDEEPLPEHTVVRERFINRKEFILTFIGYVVGPSNVWRFPYLVLKNGGAVFVLVYLVMVILVGLPLSFVELALGQFSGKNTIRVWDLSPALRGVGFSVSVVCWLTSLTFQLIMAHCLLYAFASLDHRFPWAFCKAGWTDCFQKFTTLKNWTQEQNTTLCRADLPVSRDCVCHKDFQEGCRPLPRPAGDFYYYEEILKIEKNAKPVEEFGTPPWQVALLLLFSWILITLLMLRGIRYTTKFLYVTILVPYAGLLSLVIRGALLSGSGEGVRFLFDPNSIEWEKVKNSEVWVDATSQAFFSMSTILGELFIVGSYMTFRNNYLPWDLLLVTVVDVLSSLLSAVVIFQTLGYAAHQAGSAYDITDISRTDRGLSSITFSTILLTFPVPHLWTAVFFVLLYTLTIDTQVGLVETVLTYLQDDFRIIRRHSRKSRILFSTLSFFICIILACPGGNNIVDVIDEAALTMCLPFLGFCEVGAIMWAYGVKRFLSDLEYMLAVKIKPYYVLVFYLACLLPLSLMVVFISSIVHGFSDWTSLSGGNVALLVFIVFPIPLWFVLYACKTFQTSKHLPLAKIVSRLNKPSVHWRANDGSNIHRTTETVFAEICDRFKSRIPARNKGVPGEDGFPVASSKDESLKWEGEHLFDVLFHQSVEARNSPTVIMGGEKRRALSMRSPPPQLMKEKKKRRNTLN